MQGRRFKKNDICLVGLIRAPSQEKCTPSCSSSSPRYTQTATNAGTNFISKIEAKLIFLCGFLS